MPRRTIPPKTLLNAGSMAASINSGVLDVRSLKAAGFWVSWTGTPVGTLAIEASPDGVSNFKAMGVPGLTDPAGSADGFFVDLQMTAAPFVRVAYTRSSSTGALTVIGTGKE